MLRDELGFSDPVVLNSQFKEIWDSKSTRGELFWTRISKFHIIERNEWNKFLEVSEVKVKNYQIRNIGSACSAISSHHRRPVYYNFKDRPVSAYFNGQSKSFRKEFTLIKIQNREISIIREVIIDR